MGKADKGIQILRNEKWPKLGYTIDTTLIMLDDCGWPNGHFCIHHMFDGPFKATIYHDQAQNAPVLAIEIECGTIVIYSLRNPLAKKTVDISGCRVASEGSETVYVDALTSDQQKAMDALVRVARNEKNLTPAGAGFELAEITILPNEDVNSTTIHAINSSTVVVVDRRIKGTGETHHSGEPCVPVPAVEEIPKPRRIS